MSYQFDPRPEGLYYEPFTVSFCKKTMWWLRDGAPETWIDLRSVFEALGMSWVRKWGMYCLAKRREWKLEACCDKRMKETLLAPGNKLPAILGEVYGLLGSHHAAARRAHMLHKMWRDKYAEIRSGGGTTQAVAAVKAPRAVRRRKVDAYVVRQAFHLTGKGHSKTAIARALKVSPSTIKAIAAGAYPMDAAALEVWWATFGAPQTTAAGAFTPAKQAERPAG